MSLLLQDPNLNSLNTLLFLIQEYGALQDRQGLERRRLGCLQRWQGLLAQPDWGLRSNQDEGDS